MKLSLFRFDLKWGVENPEILHFFKLPPGYVPESIACGSEGQLFLATSCGQGRQQLGRILVYAADGTQLRTFGGPQGDQLMLNGEDDDKLLAPQGIAIDAKGHCLVTDSRRDWICEYDAEGKRVGVLAKIPYPSGIALAARSNQILVSSARNNTISICDRQGTCVRTFGSEGTDAGKFRLPKAIAVDSNGRILVSDQANSRIQVFDPEGRFLLSIGSKGYHDGELTDPAGLAVRDQDSVLVVDAGHRVQMFDREGRFVASYGKFGDRSETAVEFRYPSGVAVHPDGIFVCDKVGRVRCFSL